MESTHIALINIFIIVICHFIVFLFLNDWAMKGGACGMGAALIGGWFLLFLNILWSFTTLFWVLSTHSRKSNYIIIWLFIFLGVIGNLIMTVLLEYYLWSLLIIPYLLFLGEILHLKLSSLKQVNQS